MFETLHPYPMHELRSVLEALRDAQLAIAQFDPLKRNHGRTLRHMRNLLLDPKIILATNRLLLQVDSPPIAPLEVPQSAKREAG